MSNCIQIITKLQDQSDKIWSKTGVSETIKIINQLLFEEGAQLFIQVDTECPEDGLFNIFTVKREKTTKNTLGLHKHIGATHKLHLIFL